METLSNTNPLHLLAGLCAMLAALVILKLWADRRHRRVIRRYQEHIRGMHGEWQD